jgi:hypothetical protein
VRFPTCVEISYKYEGFPHSEISGSKVARHLPEAYRRHATSFIAISSQGIHHTPLNFVLGNSKTTPTSPFRAMWDFQFFILPYETKSQRHFTPFPTRKDPFDKLRVNPKRVRIKSRNGIKLSKYGTFLTKKPHLPKRAQTKPEDLSSPFPLRG